MQTHAKPHIDSPSRGTALFEVNDPPSSGHITMTFEGQSITAPAGISVAASLLIHGVTPFRTTPGQSAARAPYCMMGVCFECLLEIDGQPNRQSCLIPVREGMVIHRQHGAPDLAAATEHPQQGDHDGER